MGHDLQARTDQAADFIAAQIGDCVPRFGIVLGTGSSVVANDIEIQNEFDYSQIPNFPLSTALGHKGRWIVGKLKNQSVIAMDGRFHLYEGHDLDAATLGIRVMHRLGVQKLAITNASGGINPNFKSGDIMIIDSHIDLMCRWSRASSVAAANQRPSKRVDCYDSEMAQLARQCARANDFEIQNGIYGALLGPNYETRAEYRMLRRIGADVAGMSTVPEVSVACKLEMRVLALSVITNVANPDSLTPTTGEEVIDAAQVAAPRIGQILRSWTTSFA